MKKRDANWYNKLTQPPINQEHSQEFRIQLQDMQIDYNKDAYGLITIKQRQALPERRPIRCKKTMLHEIQEDDD